MTVATTVYECPDCGERGLGLRRCEDCNLFTRRIGTGGHCPSCDEPISAEELITDDHQTKPAYTDNLTSSSRARCGYADTCRQQLIPRLVTYVRDGQTTANATGGAANLDTGDCPPPAQPGPTTAAAAATPAITWQVTLAELQRIPIPGLTVDIQPAPTTLVNLDTIVSTTPTDLSHDLLLAGVPVHVVATPTTYQWDFGDGTTVVTSTPGRPYPAMDITHRYTATGQVQVSVTVIYTAQFSIAGGPPQPIPQNLLIPGPPTTLTITETIPRLITPG